MKNYCQTKFDYLVIYSEILYHIVAGLIMDIIFLVLLCAFYHVCFCIYVCVDVFVCVCVCEGVCVCVCVCVPVNRNKVERQT